MTSVKKINALGLLLAVTAALFVAVTCECAAPTSPESPSESPPIPAWLSWPRPNEAVRVGEARYGGAVVVRCTTRLLTLLAPVDVVEATATRDDWYANLLWVDRRKCLLLVHADTLFPVLVTDVRKPQLADFGRYVTGTIADALADEALPVHQLGPLDPGGVLVARTASRHVLGGMNDMASMTKRVVEQHGGLRQLDVQEHNAFLRRTPYRHDGFCRPIDAAREPPAGQ